MALDVLLIAQPFEIAWSQNPMVHSFAISPYSLAERNRNLYLRVQVMIENTWDSGIFEVVREQVFYPNADGVVHLDVSTYLDPYLEFYLPAFTLRQPVECTNQTKRYKLSYTLTDENAVLVATQTSTSQIAVKGGLPYEFQNHRPYFESNTGFLTNTIVEETAQFTGLYRKQERLFLYYLSKAAVSIADTHSINLYNKENQKISWHDFTIASLKKHRVYCIPLSPDTLMPQINLDDIYYLQYVAPELSSKPIRYNTDPRKFYDTHSLMYRNSLGGLDALTLRGQADYTLDYARQQLEQVNFPEFTKNGYLKPKQQQNIVEEQYKTKGDTGFMSKAQLDTLRDLWLSEEAYELKSGRLLPIIINNTTVKLYSNRDKLFSALIEFQQAWMNRHYAQPGIESNLANSCPPVQYLSLKQITRSKLEIFWSLQRPYDLIELQITFGGSPAITNTFRFTGNTGRKEITIINPGNVDMTITVDARTICDANSDPISASAWISRSIDVAGNLAPVAVNDTYSIQSGFSSAVSLQGSVLDNDYDPDGDPIAVVVASGATNAGGTFSIDAAGNISYTPPGILYNGTDYFDYTITETSGPIPLTATARVYINVGQPNAPVVYVKLVERNVQYEGNGSSATRTLGERWAYFYSDPAGTIPLNVSGRVPAIVLTIRERYMFTSNIYGIVADNTVEYAINGNSFGVQFYTGLFFRDDFYDTYYGVLTEQYDHTILPGTGYVVI